MNDKDLATGDLQILQEVALNERVVTHPKLGPIYLKMPTLEIQRKIDAVARNKKKWLKEAKDTITDEAGNTKSIPAFKSIEQLEREYAELGWWTDTEKLKLADLSERHIQVLSELESLGFESDIQIYIGIQQIASRLIELSKDDKGNIPVEITEALNRITVAGATLLPSDLNIIRDHTTTTETDELLNQLGILHKQYLTYIKLAKVYAELITLQAQKAQLFSDSWQDQLQYYLRLAQVFYCTSKQSGKHDPLWIGLEAIESEQNLELIKWVFEELNAFWQGISDDTREKMNRYSFTNPRSTVESSTVDSPAPQESLQDGEQQEKLPMTSTIVTATTDPSLINTLS